MSVKVCDGQGGIPAEIVLPYDAFSAWQYCENGFD